MSRCLTRLSETGADALLSMEDVRPFEGATLDRLLSRRVLVEQAPIADWEVCDACECGAFSRPLRREDGAFHADCPLDPRHDVVLHPDQLRSFRIDHDALAGAIASAAGLARDPESVAPGLWHLGETASGRRLFLAFAAAVARRPDAILIMKAVSRGAATTLLTPAPDAAAAVRFAEAGIDLHPLGPLLREAPPGLGIVDLAALEAGGAAARLVFQSAAGVARVGGLTITLSHQLAPVFGRLVERALTRDPVVSGPAIEDVSGREAKDLVRELRDAFRAAGVPESEVEALIVNVRGRGWRVGLSASEIILDP